MPILMPSKVYGETMGLYVNPDRDDGLASAAVERVQVTYAGFEGEVHGGLTRPACSRVKLQYPRDTEIRNTRQICILSVEELEAIAGAMGLDALDPRWLGANVVMRGIPDLTQMPPSSRLIFDGGVSLVVDMENAPCRLAADSISMFRPGQGTSFPKHAQGRRGVTAWVEREGTIEKGERARLHMPPQRIYAHG